MKKHNYFVIIYKKLNLSINSLLESILYKLKFYNLKSSFLINKTVFSTIIILAVLCLSYLSIPFFHNKIEIQNEIKNQLYQKFAIDFVPSNDLSYSFFPKPHFILKNSSILEEEIKILEEGKFKFFISLKNIFLIKKIDINNIIIENSNFNINKKTFRFFIKILNKNLLNTNITIKDSKVFYKNYEGDVLFVNKIKKIRYYFNSKKLLNELKGYNEILNVPYLIEFQNDEIKKKNFLKMYSKIMMLKIENELDYNKNIKIGLLNHSYKNNKNTTNYELKKNSLSFFSSNKKFSNKKTYNGLVNFKPFFLIADFNINELDFFDENSLFFELIRAEILNNKNLNIKININSKKSISRNHFIDYLFKFIIEDGVINIDNSKIDWSNFLNFKISDSLFFIDNGNLFLSGKLSADIKDSNGVYRFFQTPKKSRKEIDKLEFNFKYNLDQQKVKFYTTEINNEIKNNLDYLFIESISVKKLFRNQIFFKRYINKILKAYDG